MFKTIIIYLLVLLILIIIARFIAFVSRPVIKDTKAEFNNFSEYMENVYCKDAICKKDAFPLALIVYNYNNISVESEEEKSSKIINKYVNVKDTLRFFNYIYDNAPKTILNNYPIAENLSFSWPPKLGSRYKLTAFPYPKSTYIFSAVYETISNTIDAYTFPGWMIQKRNPIDFNNSIYNYNYFRDYQDIEIIHACYPPPGAKYPLCDDGGYWMYLSTGSGVFWNTGKTFTSLNKISLLYDIYNCSTKLRIKMQELKDKKLYDKDLPPIYGKSIDDIVDKLKDKGGGSSIMVAIFSIVSSLTKHKFKAKIIGFKNLTPNDSGKFAWDNFISQTFLILYLIIFTIIQLFLNIRNKTVSQKIGIILFCLIIISFLIYLFLFVVFENFFRGLGWMTLDMALSKTNMTLHQFVEECITGNQKNCICNSLAMTQLFDLDIEKDVWALGYDSFILTSQPNKTGNWEVEICDLRRYDPKKAGIAIDGGVCGNYLGSDNELNVNKFSQIDICKSMDSIIPDLVPKNNINTYYLKTGPIKLDSSGPPFFKPDENSECLCIEKSNRLCTSCNGFLSGKLCINK